jgi:hypothetical protein
VPDLRGNSGHRCSRTGFIRRDSRFVGKSAVDRYSQGQSRGIVEMAQEAAAKELRGQLPMRIDDLTTLERVMSASTTLIYQYRVDLNESGLDTPWHLSMKNMLATNVCRQSDMRFALTNGARFQYTYFRNDGVMIADFVVTGSDCQAAARHSER